MKLLILAALVAGNYGISAQEHIPKSASTRKMDETPTMTAEDESFQDRKLADLLEDELFSFFERELGNSYINRRCWNVSPRHACRIRMIDNLNNNDVILETKEKGRNIFKVTDRVGTRDPWSEKVWFNQNGMLKTTANPSVDVADCSELLTKYEMKNDRQLTFKTLSSYPCTEFGKAVIYYLVLEWFYFG